ncbi:MAG: HEPN domain-containing protein [Candidatus Nezhaarchaeales archaeon]
MSINPLGEVKYRYRLALEHLERAKKLFLAKDWVGTILSSKLAVENFAKAVIAVFDVPTWSHDPSNQLNALIDRLPVNLIGSLQELAATAKEMVSEHGRASYGEPAEGLTPMDIYKEVHAVDALKKAEKAKTISEKAFKRLNVSL